MNFLKRHWPLFIIAAIVLFLAIVNYRPGMILTGGDNLHTEFNFPLNIQRSIFSVWVEYEGLGVLAGMGHAADLVRQLFLWLLSLVVPMELLRYVFTMLTLFIGTTGAYYLIQNILSKTILTKNNDSQPFALRPMLFAALGALFYLLNLATLQQYFTPFEVFTTSFAALPWLFLVTINYFQKHSKKNFLLLTLVLFLATPQAVVPTVFVVWLMATGILTLFLSITIKPFALRTLPFAKYYLLVFLINAFWLLPFAYFVVTGANVDVNAKINQMGSDNIYSLNKEYGNVTDVMLLRGFWFQNVEPDFQGNITYMLLPWREHMANPLIPAIGYFLFAIVALGVFVAVRTKKMLLLGLAAVFFFAFLMLTTASPPFAQINELIRTAIPLFKEVFRFVFTKFSTLASLMYAIFFAYGAYTVVTWLAKRTHHKLSHLLLFALCSLLIAMLAIFMLPAFRGDLLYSRERIKLPTAYQQLFTYMNHEDPSGRVALFPANTFWDWKFYSWGYSGSGFLWYGIRQPILDRAFDMWGTHNENYYHELSQALYAKDPAGMERVLRKYDIRYLIVDGNVIYPPAPQSLFTRELPEFLKTMPSIKKSATFDKLTVYTVTLPHRPNNFVSLSSTLPSVNTAIWNNQDQAYQSSGDYVTSAANMSPSIIYPFRSLFSGKSQKEKAFTMTEDTNKIEFTQTIPTLPTDATFLLPSLTQTETIIPAGLVTKKLPTGQSALYLELRTPEVWLGQKKIAGETYLRQIALLPKNDILKNATVNINGITTVPLRTDSELTQNIFLSLKQDNVIVISDSKKKQIAGIVIKPESITNLPALRAQKIQITKGNTPMTIKVVIPKIKDNFVSYTPDIAKSKPIPDCNIFRKGPASAVVTTNNGLGQLQVQARNATSCTSFFSPNLPHDQGYAIFITAKHIKGKPFHFWMINEDEKFSPIDTYLPKDAQPIASSFVLPPQDQYGIAYSFHVDNVAIGNETTENILQKLAVYQIPYKYLTSMVITDGRPIPSAPFRSGDQLKVSHPNESVYEVTLPKMTKDQTLILSQAYDPGWHAYALAKGEGQGAKGLELALPFLFGKELGAHVMVNGWANGWIINPTPSFLGSRQVVIVYLPQYLEYIGFILLGITGVYLVFTVLKKPKHHPSS